jgi:sulfocyanin
MSKFTLPVSLCLFAFNLNAQESPPAVDHAAHAMPGNKVELYAGITEKDLLKLGDKPNSVKITMVAAYSAANAGMNFSGYSHGKAILTVPKDWELHVTFINPSPIPHSIVVIDVLDIKKPQSPEPYFTGAATPNHLQGMSMNKAEFTFKADEAGSYAIACGFPAHASAGHWIALKISDTATTPTLQFGENPPIEIK